MMSLSKADLQRLMGNLKNMSTQEMLEALTLLEEIEKRKRLAMCQSDFLAFIAHIDTTYKFGSHLKRLGNLLMQIEDGAKDRIAVSMPPRFGKSQMISIYYPAWYLGKHPDHKVIMASHTADLAVDMARKVRNLMQSDLYQEIFPNVKIAADAKAAGKWNTSKGGEFFATGVGGALAGRGSHLAIVDDPLSEQDLKAGNTASLDVVYEWFRAGLRTRLMPEGKIAILHTRWHQRDLIGRLTKDAALNPDADQYEIFEFPAILEYPNPVADPESQEYDEEAPSVLQKSLWPEQWTLESLLRTKASMPAWQWNAQYQQSPTAQEAAIIKRDDIKWWTKEDPPSVDYTVQSWDTALTTKDRSDYSVCQTWGVWKNEDGVDNVILLNSAKGKYEFPELKRVALQQYKDWTPDTVIIETKASGQPLVDEMRRSGIYVQEFSPGKGQDKIARVNAISDMFTSGQVWFPETWWASEVVDELLAFPAGEHDDAVDACLRGDALITMADNSQKPITEVRVGDFVATPYGPKRVMEAGCTGYAPVYAVKNGLYATANHPIATDKGWRRVDSIRNSAIIDVSNFRSASWLFQKKTDSLLTRCTLTGTNTTDTQIQQAQPIGGTTRALVGKVCIGQYGSLPTGLYRMGGISITKTATFLTTSWITWSVSLKQNTLSIIGKILPQDPRPKSIWAISTSSEAKPQNGIGQRKGGRGIDPMRMQHYLKLGQLQKYLKNTISRVKNAVSCLLQMHVAHGFVLQTVGLKTTTNADALKLKKLEAQVPAGSAKLHTNKNDLTNTFAVLNAKQSSTTLKNIPVYNLSVADAECYFANGVLVHNCSLALIRIRKGGLLRLNSDTNTDDDYVAVRRAYY